MNTKYLLILIVGLIYVFHSKACTCQNTSQYIIRGRVIFPSNGKFSNQSDARLTVELQDTSLADAPAKVLARVIVKAVRFPIPFTIKYSPSNTSNRRDYSLSATIRNRNKDLLFINDQRISVTLEANNRNKVINIPVIRVKNSNSQVKKSRWPELVGKNGQEAVRIIKQETGFTDVIKIKDGSAVTTDYRTDRVRVIVNDKDLVISVPTIG